MDIRYSRQFVKQLRKQPQSVQEAFYLRLQLFEQDSYDPLLRNHALKGKLKGFYSINMTGDVRALYQIIDGQVYLYQIIGTHSQLHG